MILTSENNIPNPIWLVGKCERWLGWHYLILSATNDAHLESMHDNNGDICDFVAQHRV